MGMDNVTIGVETCRATRLDKKFSFMECTLASLLHSAAIVRRLVRAFSLLRIIFSKLRERDGSQFMLLWLFYRSFKLPFVFCVQLTSHDLGRDVGVPVNRKTFDVDHRRVVMVDDQLDRRGG